MKQQQTKLESMGIGKVKFNRPDLHIIQEKSLPNK